VGPFQWPRIFGSRHLCRNPNFGFVTKARVCKGAGQKRSMGVTSHAPESVGQCEGMDFHTPK
jgi:hypothetical protein